ncbi:MAG: response regulator, partial [Chloroflexi bacterium]|nr:response regulator [Chloroflexota bacterium]
NQALATMLGCECADFQGQSPLTLLHPEDQERATHWMERMLGGATGSPEEYRACSKDGAIVPVEVSCRLIDYGGKPALLSVLRDLTERKLLEGRLSQAQKLETVGRLAGGVAHDFNNVLTAIMGYTQLSLLLAPAECEISDHLQEIKKAADRAANLTGQLLAFSRQQVIEPKVLDLNDVVINLGKMLRRLIGEDIELITLPATELDLVKADPGQIEQVLLNLAVNARDAMPDGGKLTIKTACVTLDAEYVRHHEDASPGRHVMLVVSDTGTGISEEVQKHMFEPFFTTKMVGKGTGLGLATCFGIVQQSGGHIEVETEPGQGTSFKVYLPVTEETYEVQPKIVDSSISPQGNETVLLAEDESMVRSMVATVLRDRGYVVLEASNGEEALRMVQSQGGENIELLVTDVVMPQMNGRELAEKLHDSHPNLKFLFTSGYIGGPWSELDILPNSAGFLAKPYMPETLAVKVREALDS